MMHNKQGNTCNSVELLQLPVQQLSGCYDTCYWVDAETRIGDSAIRHLAIGPCIEQTETITCNASKYETK